MSQGFKLIRNKRSHICQLTIGFCKTHVEDIVEQIIDKEKHTDKHDDSLQCICVHHSLNTTRYNVSCYHKCEDQKRNIIVYMEDLLKKDCPTFHYHCCINRHSKKYDNGNEYTYTTTAKMLTQELGKCTHIHFLSHLAGTKTEKDKCYDNSHKHIKQA